jgi:hypothetical protein
MPTEPEGILPTLPKSEEDKKETSNENEEKK